MELPLKICKFIFFPLYFAALLIEPILKYLLIIMIVITIWSLISIFVWEKKRKVLEMQIGQGQLCAVDAQLEKIEIGATHTVTERDYANDRVEYDYDVFTNTKTTTYIDAYKKKKIKDADKGVYSYYYDGVKHKYRTNRCNDSIRLYFESSKPSKAYSINDVFNDKIGAEKKKDFIDSLVGIVIILLMMQMVK